MNNHPKTEGKTSCQKMSIFTIQVANLCVVIVTEALNQSENVLFIKTVSFLSASVITTQSQNIRIPITVTAACHLGVDVPALGDDVPGVDADVADGHQAPAPHLALPHV